MNIKYKILIVDDDLENLDVLCCGLCDCYDIHPVSNGFGEAAILPPAPDLIILEEKLLPRFIEPNTAYRHTPLLLIASSSARSAEHLSDYIAKPFDLTEVRRKIKRLVRRLEPAR